MLKKLGLFLIILLLNQYLFAQAPPTITSFSPKTAGPGDTITIIGTNLNGAQININCNATIILNTTTEIQAIVCISALSGNIDVITGHGSVLAAGFVFNGTPSITSVIPDSATAGQVVTITGKYLCPGGAAYPNLPPTISFGGVPAASITPLSTSVVQAVIGLGASGSVYLTNCCFGASTFPFLYLLPKPIVNSFTPLTGTSGSTITIKGKYLTGTTAVSFGGNPAQSFSVISDTVITAIIGTPASGNITVTTTGGTVIISGFINCAPTYATVSVSVCNNNLPYNWFGKHYVSAGLYTDTITNAGGCDSIITLNLKIKDTSSSVTQLNICSNLFPYSWNGNQFYATGTYNVILTNTVGCDSLAQLQLQTHPCTPPLITSLSSMVVGEFDTLYIYGKYFTGATSVTFGGKHEYFYVESDSVIYVGLDSVVSNGSIVVTTPLGSDSISGLSYIYPPIINSFYPTTHVGVDSSITIYGKNFIKVKNITFGGLTAVSFITVSDSVITAVVGTGRSGNISISTAYGNGSIAGFSFQPVPVMHSYSPTLGGHGTAITIKGIYFTGTTNIYFGGVAVDSFHQYSDSIIIAYVGTGDSGNLTVQTLYGTDSIGGFIFIPPPLINSFSPTANDGTGTLITITGKYFTYANAVSFGGTSAKSFSVISDSVITAFVGRGSSGNINITSPYGSTSFAGFIYIPYPVMYGFSPDTAGLGSMITIKGINFTTTTNVNFGGTNADSFKIVSDSVIAAFVGKGSTGKVTVTNPYGVSSLPGFVAIPVVTSFAPLSGPIGTTVIIFGYNFDKNIAGNIIYFGGVRATIINASDSQLVVTVPPAAAYQSITVTANNLIVYSSKPFTVTFPGGGHKFTNTTFSQKSDVINTAGSFCTGDLDGDGKLDMAIAIGGPVLTYRNLSNGHFFLFGQGNSYPVSAKAKQVIFADLNGDGKLDMASASEADGQEVSIFKNTGTVNGVTSFSSQGIIDYPALGGFDVFARDIDGDGKPDLIISSDYSNIISIFKNTSTKDSISFSGRQDYAAVQDPAGVYFSDFDGDGKPDIAIANAASDRVSIYRNTSTIGNISLAGRIDIRTSNYLSMPDIAIGDFDGDGKTDLALLNPGAQTMSILRNISSPGNISFATQTDYPTGINTASIAVGDLDGDGKPDIAVANSYDSSISVYRNTCTIGNISFDDSVNYYPGRQPDEINISDIDGDGKPDLVVANGADYLDVGTNTISILRNQVGEPINTQLCASISSTSIQSSLTGSTYQWQLSIDSVNFFNINNNTNYSGVNSGSLNLNNIPSSWYGYQYRCVVDGNNSDVYTLKFTDTWKGNVDSTWENPLNWSCGAVPDSNTDVIISSGTVVLSSNTIVRSLTVNPTASFTIVTPYNLTVTH